MSSLLGISLLLMAVGAVLAFGITATVEGFEVTTAGVVLIAVGALGLLIWLILLLSFSLGRGHEQPPP